MFVILLVAFHLSALVTATVTLGYYGPINNSSFPSVASFALDSATGRLTHLTDVAAGPSPSWLLPHPTISAITYVIHEVSPGSLWAFRNGQVAGQWPSGGDGPVYASIKDNHLMIAHYLSGDVVVHSLSPTTGLVTGTTWSRNFGAGSFAHCVAPDDATSAVFVITLGLDRIYQFRLNATTGTLDAAQPPYVSLPVGSGPRHIVMHSTLPRAFASLENGRGMGLAVFHLHRETGTLTVLDIMQTSLEVNTTALYPSELILTDDGAYLLISTRDAYSTAGRDNVAVFRVSSSPLQIMGIYALPGCVYPRSMALAEGHAPVLVVGCQHSNSTMSLQLDMATGLLEVLSTSQFDVSVGFVGGNINI